MDKEYIFSPIGIIHSCFTEKFGIPRQPGLATAARGTLEILAPYDQDEAFKGLTEFSHLWLIFIFHGIPIQTQFAAAPHPVADHERSCHQKPPSRDCHPRSSR